MILIPGASEFQVEYEICNNGQKRIDSLFGPELNLTLLAGKADDRYYYITGQSLTDRSLASKGINSAVNEMGMADHWLSIDLNLSFDQPLQYGGFQ